MSFFSLLDVYFLLVLNIYFCALLILLGAACRPEDKNE